MRTTAAPGRARLGVDDRRRCYDWDTQLAELPELLAEKVDAPSVEPGVYDLVIDPRTCGW